MQAQLVRHTGSCHCGRVRFAVQAPAVLRVKECNCSICSVCAYQHLIVSRACFELLCGEQVLSTYTFNTGTAKHLFCSFCGVKPFYVPRSHPDGYSVNARPNDLQVRIGLFHLLHRGQHPGRMTVGRIYDHHVSTTTHQFRQALVAIRRQANGRTNPQAA
jgi:hypothetical protein